MRIILVCLLLFTLVACNIIDNQTETITEEQEIQNEPLVKPPIQPQVKSDKCGNGQCEPNENYAICPLDCIETCGDKIVQDDENLRNCRTDLYVKCGDNICDEWEHYQWCRDCPECIVDTYDKYNGPNECPPNTRW